MGYDMIADRLSFFKGKRVFLTGHTGFKGSWMSRVLIKAGAELTGFSLSAPTDPNLFEIAGLNGSMRSIIGDVRDFDAMMRAFDKAAPEIVIHMAAQPIVRESYRAPRDTFETNVMGTVNLLECVRRANSVKSVLNVTTDKVYLNREWVWGYREDEALDGFDPYSNSKSCSELVTHSYYRSFFTGDDAPSISTARAGNVIGGGDFAKDRIIPDCVRAVSAGESIVVRNPWSIRPYQHVLEPIMAYLMIVRVQYEDPRMAGWYNVGPDEVDCITTGKLADMFVQYWGKGAKWINISEADAPHEANFLKLDCSKIKRTFEWSPTWHIEEAIRETVAWFRVWAENGDVRTEMDREIELFLANSAMKEGIDI